MWRVGLGLPPVAVLDGWPTTVVGLWVAVFAGVKEEPLSLGSSLRSSFLGTTGRVPGLDPGALRPSSFDDRHHTSSPSSCSGQDLGWTLEAVIPQGSREVQAGSDPSGQGLGWDQPL